MSVGLCLSGGGIRAAFHIGVLMALEKAGIKIDFVSGSSSGAIVASLYAAGFSPESILKLFYCYSKKVIEVDKKSIFKGVLSANKGRSCINRFDNLEMILKNVFYSRDIFDINDVLKKLAVCTVDANLGKLVYFVNTDKLCSNEYINNGILYKIVRASSAYPVIFTPSLYKGRVLVDGGVMNNIPVCVLKQMGADKVIAVDVSNKIDTLKSLSMLNVGLRCIDIMGKCNSLKELENADFVIKPVNIGNIGMFDFNCVNVLVNEGYCVTKENIKKIITCVT